MGEKKRISFPPLLSSNELKEGSERRECRNFAILSLRLQCAGKGKKGIKREKGKELEERRARRGNID